METIKQLSKYKLDFELAYAYVYKNLDQTNHLSSGILQYLDLKKGVFFTLLLNDADLSQLYKFKEYGILVQNPMEEQIIDGRKSFYSWIPNIRKEISLLMQEKFFSKIHFSYMFDDCLCYLENVVGYSLFEQYGYHVENEIYYVINKKNSSAELVNICLDDSNTIWHSLCVFTGADFSKINKQPTKDDFKEICQKTEFFMVGAYDGEGYVFWEKEGCHFFE